MGTWSAGQFTLYPGNSCRISWWWGDDRGPVFAEAREFKGSTRNNLLTVKGYGTVRKTDNTIVYYLDVLNQGPQVATFEVIGVTF